MRIRKFEITSVEVEPRGLKPFYTVHYKGIKNKEWVTGKVFFSANNEAEAKYLAMQRFGGIN